MQKEYLLGYALTFALLFFGMLVVCIPRPRKSAFLTKEEAEKQKRLKKKRKAIAKKKKTVEKAKKAKAKAKAKK